MELMQGLMFYKIRKKNFYDEENLILKNVLQDQNFNELDSIVKDYDDSPRKPDFYHSGWVCGHTT